APGYNAMWGPDNAMNNGNLRGIINSLDHIKDLGANALWMTPIFDSSKAMGGEKLQSTGYFTNNFFEIDPHFGTEDDLRELVDEAHKRDIYVILDGVFGHHGGVTEASPSGYTLDVTQVESNRGAQGGTGNIAYPGSLDYIKEVATYWIDKFGIDGWRLDQAYQATQGGHNYWNEIRGDVEKLTAERKARGEEWGTLGYMVGEDWGTADVINRGVYKDGGLVSAFDFDGKELISGPMQETDKEGLENGWADVVTILSKPTARGYLNDEVMPNLFLSNHDGYRLADHFDPTDPYYYEKMMARHAILAAYSGPVTLYYGDEFGDDCRDAVGAQKDNIARTTGHLEPRNDKERQLRAYVAAVMKFRGANPAMWRGESEFETVKGPAGNDILIVRKTDKESGNKVAVIFSEKDAEVVLPEAQRPVKVKAWIPEFVRF
ncbi:MAG: hypothetical protein K2M10_03980, partial [Muribaculaceae bacterium]|nr:hypothetical protein [Muribaculaceae bacterium]